MVRLALLLARERQLDTELSAQPQRRSSHLRRARLVRLYGREQARLAQLHQLRPGESLRPMVRERMGDLVGEHDRETVLVLRDGEDAAVHGDLATGHAPGVDRLRIVDHRRLPLVPGMELRLGGFRQPLAHSLDDLDVGRVGIGLRLGDLLLVRLHPKLVDGRVPDQIELLPPGYRRRRARRQQRRHEEECLHTGNLHTVSTVCRTGPITRASCPNRPGRAPARAAPPRGCGRFASGRGRSGPHLRRGGGARGAASRR